YRAAAARLAACAWWYSSIARCASLCPQFSTSAKSQSSSPLSPAHSTALAHFGTSSPKAERNALLASPIQLTGSIWPRLPPISSTEVRVPINSRRSLEIASGSPGMRSLGSLVCPSSVITAPILQIPLPTPAAAYGCHLEVDESRERGSPVIPVPYRTPRPPERLRYSCPRHRRPHRRVPLRSVRSRRRSFPPRRRTSSTCHCSRLRSPGTYWRPR